MPKTIQKSLARRLCALVCSLLALVLAMPVMASANTEFEQALSGLVVKNFGQKSTAITAIAAVDHPKTEVTLSLLLDGKLYYRKSDKRVVVAKKIDDGYQITDAVNDEALGVVSKRKLRKIAINNKLRKQLKAHIAALQLSNPDADVRLAAVEQMAKEASPEILETLSSRLPAEPDKDVRKTIEMALALGDLRSDDANLRLSAITTLAGSVNPAVRNELTALAQGDQIDDETRAAVEKALRSIETKVQTYEFIQTIFFGLSLGSVLMLAAIGLTITFGVMGVINMAHGELIMLGAYTTYVVQIAFPELLEWSLLIAVPAAFLVSGLVGIAIERGVIRHLYGRPLETLLATFGISLVLQQAVRSIFTPLNRSVATPEWLSGSLEINSVLSLTYNRLYILVFSLVILAALVLVFKRTRLGLEIRAVTQNRNMAKAMGVRSGWVDALTFGLGSGIAGIAGVALSQITNVGPNLGQSYIIDSFMVVVFGGVGNLWGTLVGGFSLGLATKFLEPFAGAMMAKILILVFIILFIQKRPRGLFPQKGRAAEN